VTTLSEKSCHWGGTFSKRYTFVPKGLYHNCTNMYHEGTNMHPLGKKVYHEGTNMHPLGTKVYLLKRYRPRDSFRTFFSESDLFILIG